METDSCPQRKAIPFSLGGHNWENNLRRNGELDDLEIRSENNRPH